MDEPPEEAESQPHEDVGEGKDGHQARHAGVSGRR